MPDPQSALTSTTQEALRKKLDGIVSQMHANGEPDESIQFVVDDFKKKYYVSKPDDSLSIGTVAKTVASDIYHGIADPIKQYMQTGDLTGTVGGAIVDPMRAQGRQAIDAAKQGRYSEAVGHGLASVIPVAGPMAASVGENIPKTQPGTGTPDERAQAVGHIVSTVGQMAAPEVSAEHIFPAVNRALATRAASKAMPGTGTLFADLPKSIPPTKSTPYSPLDIQRSAPYLADAHGTSPIETVEHFVDAADSGITQIEGQVRNYLDAFPHATIDVDPLAAVRSKLSTGARSSDVSIGLKELDDLGLNKKLTLSQADDIRHRLNAENKATLKKNQYDAATARESDPAFAAREAAANALRDGIYDKLNQLGVPDVRALRLDEGALIKLRNAGQNQIFNGQKTVSGTGTNSLTAKVARHAATGAGAVAGSYLGGPIGGGAGALAANEIATRMMPPNLTRDALMARAFEKLKMPGPTYPAVPARQTPAGLLSAPPIVTPLAADASGGQLRPAASHVVVTPDGMRRIFTSEAGQAAVNAPRYPQPPPQAPMRALPRGPIRPAPPADASRMDVLPAKSIIVRDPKTGRFKRVWTSETK